MRAETEQPFTVHWLDRQREPKDAPDPNYPFGIDLDVSKGAKATCTAKLPYPAKRCGVYIVQCQLCGFTAAVTTAGRADDPKSVKIPCKLASGAVQ